MLTNDVVIVEALRTPSGRAGGALSGMHPADLLGVALTALVERSGIDPAVVDQVVCGCISQSGAQSFNIGRTASPRPRSTRSADRRSRLRGSPRRWLRRV
jgi:acetyl-CoA acetyltransferase